jgi:hypothetical protein
LHVAKRPRDDVEMADDTTAAGRVEEEEDPHSRQVFDLNWSNDGSALAAGIERQVVRLDMKKILQTAPETLLEMSEARLSEVQQ